MQHQHLAILHHRSSRSCDEHRGGTCQDLRDCVFGVDDWGEDVEWGGTIRDWACDWGDCDVSFYLFFAGSVTMDFGKRVGE